MPKINKEIYIGVMSGTSLDGVDVAIVDFSADKVKVVGVKFYPYSKKLKDKIKNFGVDTCELNTELGVLYANCINNCLAQYNIANKQVRGIGLHGQTVAHQPHAKYPYSRQLGSASVVAHKTGITTVADFRNMDICAGGEGAPLVPAFHSWVFKQSDKNLAVLNIGGIANITIIPSADKSKVLGFDTGPGNCLSDDWTGKNLNKSYDRNGLWAKSGKVNLTLLNAMLKDEYFSRSEPKSTGREYFNLDWLARFSLGDYNPEDIQATVLELVAIIIVDAIKKYPIDEALICGGGIHNKFLFEKLEDKLQPLSLLSTASKGIDPDMVEAVAFAWLARQTINSKPGNLPSVTGARKPVILGAIYQGAIIE